MCINHSTDQHIYTSKIVEWAKVTRSLSLTQELQKKQHITFWHKTYHSLFIQPQSWSKYIYKLDGWMSESDSSLSLTQQLQKTTNTSLYYTLVPITVCSHKRSTDKHTQGKYLNERKGRDHRRSPNDFTKPNNTSC